MTVQDTRAVRGTRQAQPLTAGLLENTSLHKERVPVTGLSVYRKLLHRGNLFKWVYCTDLKEMHKTQSSALKQL